MPAYSWQEILPWMDAIRKQATDQFIAAWRTSQTNKAKDFVWHETVSVLLLIIRLSLSKDVHCARGRKQADSGG
ncbi:hypothetical protein FBU59_002191 [Linderina macrospora]|uniref:Uncharacterized protein n=1 Tax=Linderina macrospora TaxID=4868 RepID=A0ACC1JBQ4_9FUNG|nr:hypothetical protein FBU59_002191 [Linderina macrospora]